MILSALECPAQNLCWQGGTIDHKLAHADRGEGSLLSEKKHASNSSRSVELVG